MRELAEISELYIYPIKSLPGIKVDQLIVTKLGVAHPENASIIDRYMMMLSV